MSRCGEEPVVDGGGTGGGGVVSRKLRVGAGGSRRGGQGLRRNRRVGRMTSIGSKIKGIDNESMIRANSWYMIAGTLSKVLN